MIRKIISFLSFLILLFLAGCTSKETSMTSPVPTLKIKESPGPGGKAAWELEWEQTISKAKKEGSILMYGSGTGLEGARDIFIRIMKDKFNIEVQMVIGRGAELIAKILNERKAGLYLVDIWIGGPDTFYQLLPYYILEPIETNLILPEVKNPEKWLYGKFPAMDKNGMIWSTLASLYTAINFNTTMVKTNEISSYNDLLAPRWKGKIIMEDPTTVGGGHSWVHQASVVMGWDYIKALANQKPDLTRDGRLLLEWVARGKYPLAIGGSKSTLMNLVEAGATIDRVVELKEGKPLTGSNGYFVILKNSVHPNARQVFLNWFLSQEGQQIWSKEKVQPSRRMDASQDHLLPADRLSPDKRFVDVDTEEHYPIRVQKLEWSRELFAPLLK